MSDVLSATVREHFDSKTLRLVDASWPFVYWNFFLFYILLYRVVNKWRNNSLSPFPKEGQGGNTVYLPRKD